MTVQTSVTAAPIFTAPGYQYGSDFPARIENAIAAEAIPFGAWVVFKVKGECILPAAAGDCTGFQGGVALVSHEQPSQAGYAAGDVVRVLTLGLACVLSEEALALGDTLTARHGTGAGGSQKGAFRNDVDTSTAAAPQTPVRVHIPGAANLTVVKVGA